MKLDPSLVDHFEINRNYVSSWVFYTYFHCELFVIRFFVVQFLCCTNYLLTFTSFLYFLLFLYDVKWRDELVVLHVLNDYNNTFFFFLETDLKCNVKSTKYLIGLMKYNIYKLINFTN